MVGAVNVTLAQSKRAAVNYNGDGFGADQRSEFCGDLH
jgi:hypothetical protein